MNQMSRALDMLNRELNVEFSASDRDTSQMQWILRKELISALQDINNKMGKRVRDKSVQKYITQNFPLIKVVKDEELTALVRERNQPIVDELTKKGKTVRVRSGYKGKFLFTTQPMCAQILLTTLATMRAKRNIFLDNEEYDDVQFKLYEWQTECPE